VVVPHSCGGGKFRLIFLCFDRLNSRLDCADSHEDVVFEVAKFSMEKRSSVPLDVQVRHLESSTRVDGYGACVPRSIRCGVYRAIARTVKNPVLTCYLCGETCSASARSTWRSVVCGSESRIPSSQRSLHTRASTSLTCRTTKDGRTSVTTIFYCSVTSQYVGIFTLKLPF